MSDLLIVQCYAGVADQYEPFVARTAPVMHRYAHECGADYQLFIGRRDPTIDPPWDRCALIGDALTAGYRKVAYMDCDVLVVDLKRSIFDATDDVVSVQSVRFPIDGAHVENDGVMVINNTPAARDLYAECWDRRHEPISGWQQGLYDLAVAAHPSMHRPLDPRFNWFDWSGGVAGWPPLSEAVIVAWHAYGFGKPRAMSEGVTQFWGTTEDQMRTTIQQQVGYP